MEAAQNNMVDPAAASARMLEAAGIEDIEELTPKPNPMQEQMAAAELSEKQAHAALMNAQAQSEGATGLEAEARMQELTLKAQIAQATLELKRLELFGRQAEAQATAQAAMLEGPEKEAKIGLTHAQTEKVYADIDKDRATLALTAQKQQTDAALAADQNDLARQTAVHDAQQTDREFVADRQQAAVDNQRADKDQAFAQTQAKADGKRADADSAAKRKQMAKPKPTTS
jgi:hypothetical protein